MTVHFQRYGTPGYASGMHMWVCDWCNAISPPMHGWNDTPIEWQWEWSDHHRPYPEQYVSLANGVPDQYTMRRCHEDLQFCCKQHADLFETNVFAFFKYPSIQDQERAI